MTRKKMCKREDSRSEKSPTWHLKKMVDLTEQVLRHGREILIEDSESMRELKKIYLALNMRHLEALKREGVVS